jgi:hypothetical protein
MICKYCGDYLFDFIEELEDGSLIYVRVCPTCYIWRGMWGVPSKKVAVKQQADATVSAS